jgi:hypothetical protein
MAIDQAEEPQLVDREAVGRARSVVNLDFTDDATEWRRTSPSFLGPSF